LLPAVQMGGTVGTPRFHEAVDLYLQGLRAAGRSRYTVKGRCSALSTLKAFAKSDDLRRVSRTIPAFLSGQFAVLDHNSATLKWQQLHLILGHSDLSTTMRYLGRESERALEAQRRMNPADALLGGDSKVVPFRR